jgi:hypothetical protein
MRKSVIAFLCRSHSTAIPYHLLMLLPYNEGGTDHHFAWGALKYQFSSNLKHVWKGLLRLCLNSLIGVFNTHRRNCISALESLALLGNMPVHCNERQKKKLSNVQLVRFSFLHSNNDAIHVLIELLDIMFSDFFCWSTKISNFNILLKSARC